MAWLHQTLHVSLVLTTVTICGFTFNNTLFAWHPILMTVGYVLLMAEGILGAIGFRGLEGHERLLAIQSHLMMQARATVCICIGFGAIYLNKVKHGKTHFKSLHAKVGLAALVLSAAAPTLGLIAFRKLGLLQRFPERVQPLMKTIHRQVGVVTWYVALVAVFLALPHHAVHKAYLTSAWQALVVLSAALMLAALRQQPSSRSRPMASAAISKAV